MDKYRPITCTDYDHIELACIRQRPLTLELTCGEQIQGTAITVEASANKCEWLTLQTSYKLRKVRLDKISAIHHQQEGFDSIILATPPVNA